MRYFLDTEFIENGKTIDLMSIGIVREDGKTYYAEAIECITFLASEWVKYNVMPYLKGGEFKKSRSQIKQDILALTAGDDHIEFWGYYADYDWVVFCQLFGTMMDLPESFPMYCNDFKQIMYMENLRKKDLGVVNDTEHNALSEAIELRDMYYAYLKYKQDNEEQGDPNDA